MCMYFKAAEEKRTESDILDKSAPSGHQLTPYVSCLNIKPVKDEHLLAEWWAVGLQSTTSIPVETVVETTTRSWVGITNGSGSGI